MSRCGTILLVTALLPLPNAAMAQKQPGPQHPSAKAAEPAAKPAEGELLTSVASGEETLLVANYLPALREAVREAWLPLVPSEAKAPRLRSGWIQLSFDVLRDGTIHPRQADRTATTTSVAMARAAWGALQHASKKVALPAGIEEDKLRFRITFWYNPAAEAATGHAIVYTPDAHNALPR